MGLDLSKAKRDVLDGEYLIVARYFGVKVTHDNVVGDYMTKVAELAALMNKGEKDMDYNIEKVEK